LTLNPGFPLPKRNYGFEKRQKELAKAEKRKLKEQRRAERTEPGPDDPTIDPPISPEPEPGK
jgi:hypothetical protein